jgi:D-3-phosphoglycerate dehydrogenase
LTGTVLVTWSGFVESDAETAGVLRDAGLTVRFAPRLRERSPEEVVELAGDAVAVIADADPFNASVISRVPQLRVIARVGVGLDSVDLVAARQAGIAVTTTPGVGMEATVADHALCLMLAAVRCLLPYDASVRAAQWERIGAVLGGDLHGSVVGLVGLGRIGREVTQRLAGFDVTVLAHDPFAPDLPGVRIVSFDEVIQRSDVLSLHAPLTPETAGIISHDALARMKPGAVLVNTARGGLVDEPALIEALTHGRLGAAGLDVFSEEPASFSPLWSLPNVVLSPHIAGVSRQSIHAMTRRAVACVLGVLRGDDLTGVVN